VPASGTDNLNESQYHALSQESARVIRRAAVKLALPVVCAWAKAQESVIIREGVALTPGQIDDAKRIGIKAPEKVRLRVVDHIPFPFRRVLRIAGRKIGFVPDGTIGLTLRYGIFVRADHWGERRLVVHELAHTAQYERLGGLRPFLDAYLLECMTPPGYPFGKLEQEARSIEYDLCGIRGQ
jgi:hypothetical protein